MKVYGVNFSRPLLCGGAGSLQSKQGQAFRGKVIAPDTGELLCIDGSILTPVELFTKLLGVYAAHFKWKEEWKSPQLRSGRFRIQMLRAARGS